MSNLEPMSTETLTALRGSIRKWERIVAGVGEDRGSTNCPLCHLFRKNRDCQGCPVSTYTGQDSCDGTPYDDYSEAEERVFFRKRLMQKHAERELAFLRSLLPLGLSQ